MGDQAKLNDSEAFEESGCEEGGKKIAAGEEKK